MPNLQKCNERAQECRRKAEVVSSPRDRAQWLKLAEDWMAFSRIPFQPETAIHETRFPEFDFAQAIMTRNKNAGRAGSTGRALRS